MKVKSESEVTQSCPTLSDPMDCSLPGSSVHGIFQARVLEWGAIAFSAGHLVLSKISIRDLVHTKMSLIFSSFQTIWHGPNMFMDTLDRTKVQGLFGMDQMSYGEIGQDQMSANHFR